MRPFPESTVHYIMPIKIPNLVDADVSVCFRGYLYLSLLDKSVDKTRFPTTFRTKHVTQKNVSRTDLSFKVVVSRGCN